MIRGCHLHGLRWWVETNHYCKVCVSEADRRKRAAWKSKPLDEKCAELRRKLPPRQGVRKSAEQKAERLAVGKRALELQAQGLSMTVICKRFGRGDGYVRQGMREAREAAVH